MSLLPTYTVPRRIGGEASGHGLEDTEEGGWMYASLPRTPKTTKERWAATVGLFKASSKFRRYFVRVSIRNGTTSAHILDTDDPDEAPLVVYDLGSVVNVTKLSIPVEEALQFVTSNGETEELECIHGQLVLGLELGEPGVLRLAFPKTTVRDAWATWFSELVVQRELNDIDAGIGDSPVAEKTMSVHIPALQSTIEGKQTVSEYTRRFLQSSVRASRADEVPNKGKIDVMPMGFQTYVPCVISGNMKSGVLTITPRRPSLFGPKVPPQLAIGSDDVKVVAALPWKTDFAVYTNEASAWSFEAKNLDQRNAWVNYFRTVKGRGKLAQTDQQTFPYLNSAEVVAHEVDEQANSIARTLKHGITIQRSAAASSSSDESDLEDGPFQTSSPGTEAAKLLSATPTVLTFERALEDFPHLAWTTVDDIESPRSNDSEKPRSIRGFKPFTAHLDTVVLSYVDATCAPHLLGRRNFHLGLHPGSMAHRAIEAQRRDLSASASKRTLRTGSFRSPTAATRQLVKTRARSQSQSPRGSPRRASSPTAARDVSPLDTSRTLKLGLSRLRIAAEDKERLRPKMVGPSNGRSRTPFGTSKSATNQNTSRPSLLTAPSLSRNDMVRIPKCLFSNVAPHIALSPHLGSTTRR